MKRNKILLNRREREKKVEKNNEWIMKSKKIVELETATEQFRVAIQKVKNAGFDVEFCQPCHGAPPCRNKIPDNFYLEVTPQKIIIGEREESGK